MLHSLSSITEQTIKKTILDTLFRLGKPSFFRYNENFFFHSDRIDSDKFKKYGGSIYRVGCWNASGLLHNDWGNSLESETETKVRNRIRNQQGAEVGELKIDMACGCS